MKILVHLAFLTIAVSVSSQTFAQANLPDALRGNPLEDKMVGGLPASPLAAIHGFDMEGAVQDSVTGIAGQPVGHLLPVDGYIGRAVHFDGTTHAEVPIDLFPTNMPDMTIAMMLKADAIPDDPDELRAVPTSGYVFADGDSYIILNNQKKTSAFLSAYTAKATVYDSATFQVPHEIWHMVAMTRKIEKRTNDEGEQTDHTILQFYVNGRMKESVADIGDISKLSARPPLIKFGAFGERSTKLRGAIDQVVVFDRAMGKEELDELRDLWRQTAGNEWFSNRNGARPIEASLDSQLPTQVDGSTSSDGSLSEEITFGYEPPSSELSPGSGEPSISDPPDRLGKPPNAGDVPAETNANTQHRDAAAQVGIDNSAALDGIVPGVGGSELEPPVPAADEAEALIGSDEGQALLQSADWRIEGVVPHSIDETKLYPGGEVTLKVRISKDDAANKIPSVKLVTNVGPGTPSPTYDLTLDTGPAKSTDERDVPIKLPVPANLQFEDGATQTTWRPRIWLNDADGRPLRDTIAGNHSRELTFTVENENVDNSCTEVVESDDGTRTTRPCLEQDGGRASIYIDHTVLVSTDFEYYRSQHGGVRNLMLFEDSYAPLAYISIREERDMPCSISIGAGPGMGFLSGRNCSRDPSLLFNNNPDSLDFAAPSGDVITGLSVCRNSNGGRLKGFQFETRTVMDDANLSTSSNLHPKAYHPNCDDWTPLERCQPGAAAAGLEVHWGVGTKDFIHSINLMCGEVLVREQGE